MKISIGPMIRISAREPKIISNAIILDDLSQRELKKRFPGKHPKYSGHHITISYGKNEQPEKFGEKVQIIAEGYANDDKAEALLVSCGGIHCDNTHPHITISTESSVKPVYSNELLSNGYDKIEPFVLYGTVGSYIRGKYITEKIDKDR